MAILQQPPCTHTVAAALSAGACPLCVTIAPDPGPGGYQIIYADPPWRYDDSGCRGAAQPHYQTMGFEQIASLPVADIAARDAVMFIWGTHPKLADVLALIPRWGFVYKSIAFMWVKTRGSYSDGSGKPFFGLGRWTRGNTEPCYLAVRGKPSRISAGVSQIVLGVDDIVVAPVGRHSAKPPEVRQKIVDLMGPLRRIELFARERVPGWDCWGNEVESDVVLFPRLQHALKGETK